MKLPMWLWETILIVGAALSVRIMTEGLAPALVGTAVERVYARRARRRR